MSVDTCVCCGEYVPEGQQVCRGCMEMTTQQKYTEEQIQKAIRMHKQGLTFRYICAKMGIENLQGFTSVCNRRIRKEKEDGR